MSPCSTATSDTRDISVIPYSSRSEASIERCAAFAAVTEVRAVPDGPRFNELAAFVGPAYLRNAFTT